MVDEVALQTEARKVNVIYQDSKSGGCGREKEMCLTPRDPGGQIDRRVRGYDKV